VKRLEVLAAALTWAVVLAAILIVTGSGDTVPDGVPGTWTIALVAALAVALTLGLALSPLPLGASYVAAHLAGGVVVVAVEEGPRLPWAWHALPGPAALFARGATSVDRTTLVLVTVALAWELSYACTWLVVRDRRVWLALGLIVGTLTLRGPRPLQGRDAYLAVLCLSGLVLALVVAARERRRVLPRRLHSGPGMRCAPLLLLPLAGGLVAGAWAAPVPSARTVAALAARDWPHALDYLLTHVGPSAGLAGDGVDALVSFGSSLPIGGAFHPDGAPVLNARIADPALSPYWRGAVYDRYAQGGWRMLPAHLVQEAARTDLPTPAGAATGAPITQVVTLLRPSTILFTAGLPWRIDMPAIAALANGGVGAGVLSLAPERRPFTGTYAAASLPAPTAPISPAPIPSQELRALDLRLPPLPARLTALAHRLAANLSDPFSQAWAIQAYLRGSDRRYRYDTAPPPTPAGQDPVDYFLFGSRRGFCTHFATAMVVLARLAGIPARLVTGFAAGHLVDGRFIVTTADAHAWPELWIAGRGWITFEPTPNFPTPFQANAVVATRTSSTAAPSPQAGTPAARPSARVSATRAPTAQPTSTRTPAAQPSVTPTVGRAPVPPSPDGGPHLGWPRLHLPIAPSAVLAAVLAVLVSCAVIVALRARAGADALYGRMCHLADLLHAGPRGGHTPLEWATLVAARAPDDGAVVLTLTTLYVRQRYGGYHPQPTDLALARASWRTLRRRWIVRLLTRRPL
jgi:transglutaminase-like putative cysteine protease